MSTKKEPNKRKGVIYERIYEVILYEEDGDIKNYIPDDLKGVYAYICHDKDVKEDGTPKKKHYHLILWFDREKSIHALSKELGIAQNRIDWKADIYGTLQYLIHKNHPDKYQYDFNSVVTNFDDLYHYIYPQKREKCDETGDLELIMHYIQNHIGTLRLYDIYCFCLTNNCWTSYRRNYTIIKDILMEERYIERQRFVHTLHEDNKIDRETGEVSVI